MFGKKKGQAAMEYLMTYGWAILAVVIVGGVLYYYGVFEPDVPDQACPTATVGVDHGDWLIDTDADTLDLVVTNNAGEEINVTNVTGDGIVDEGTGLTLGVADSESIDGIDLNEGYETGDTVELDITFTYDAEDLTGHTSTCTITGEA
ncbi:MAG: hypothetical protein ACLFSS_03825 [Candidatus Aenigmatarchaeota archaeon]